MIEQDIQNRIKFLSDKIERNEATLQDYYAYEKLLIASGVDQYKIQSKLNEAGFESLEDYYNKRQAAKTLQQKREINDAAVLGALVGLGIGVLIGLSTKSK